jgi:hypothetical protein
MKKRNAHIKPLTFENYLTMIRASVGAKLWRNLYFQVGRQRKDILKNGELSCAFYVSSILTVFGFIGAIHATVDGTIMDLVAHGWKKTNRPMIGDVIVWAPRITKNDTHPHLGFYIGNGTAINHNDEGKVPMRHPISYRPVAYFLRCPTALR